LAKEEMISVKGSRARKCFAERRQDFSRYREQSDAAVRVICIQAVVGCSCGGNGNGNGVVVVVVVVVVVAVAAGAAAARVSRRPFSLPFFRFVVVVFFCFFFFFSF
jgi:hypothetical protein